MYTKCNIFNILERVIVLMVKQVYDVLGGFYDEDWDDCTRNHR